MICLEKMHKDRRFKGFSEMFAILTLERQTRVWMICLQQKIRSVTLELRTWKHQKILILILKSLMECSPKGLETMKMRQKSLLPTMRTPNGRAAVGVYFVVVVEVCTGICLSRSLRRDKQSQILQIWTHT